MKTILIVEDMAIFREPLEAVLRREGYRVVCAADGQEGLAAMAGEVPAAVLLDLSLPVMSGQAMLAKMRENPRLARVPVVVLSAAADRDRIVEAVRLGISSYMLKSQFSLRTMLERLRQAIGEGEGAESADRVPGAPQPGETGSPEAEPAALALPRAIAQARRIAGAPGRAGAAAASPAQAAAPAALSMAGP
ncbi:MAG: response regulator, partial [Phycisphaerales bacterium]